MGKHIICELFISEIAENGPDFKLPRIMNCKISDGTNPLAVPVGERSPDFGTFVFPYLETLELVVIETYDEAGPPRQEDLPDFLCETRSITKLISPKAKKFLEELQIPFDSKPVTILNYPSAGYEVVQFPVEEGLIDFEASGLEWSYQKKRYITKGVSYLETYFQDLVLTSRVLDIDGIGCPKDFTHTLLSTEDVMQSLRQSELTRFKFKFKSVKKIRRYS